MKHLRLSIVLAFSIALLGCSTNGLHPEQTAVPWKQLAEEWRPYTNQISSPVQLTAVLESRWPLVSILPACKAIGPFPKGGQNLVTVGQNTWEGVLHKGKRTGFDRIWWYARLKDDKLDKYSLNVVKGHRLWVLEIGDQQRLRELPWILREKTR